LDFFFDSSSSGVRGNGLVMLWIDGDMLVLLLLVTTI
jgi:hypothetical protein